MLRMAVPTPLLRYGTSLTLCTGKVHTLKAPNSSALLPLLLYSV